MNKTREKTLAEIEAAKNPENERYLEMINDYWNERYKEVPYQNNLSLTLGYGALFSAMFWLHGNVPLFPFFLALGALILSLIFFFSLLFYNEYLAMAYGATHVNLYQKGGTFIEVYKNYGNYCKKVRALRRLWPVGYWVAIILAGITAISIVFMCSQYLFKENYHKKITSLQSENTALRQELDMALSTLLHERIMHFKR